MLIFLYALKGHSPAVSLVSALFSGMLTVCLIPHLPAKGYLKLVFSDINKIQLDV